MPTDLFSGPTGEQETKNATSKRIEEYRTLFNDAMPDLATLNYSSIVSEYDFSDVSTIIDVGGETGTLLALILKNCNWLRGVLFDLPEVVADAHLILEAHGVADRCKTVGGDFFRSVPPGGDIYFLATIIHDWDDERALVVIRNCRRAMDPGGSSCQPSCSRSSA